jgi:hypothetical protein
MMFKPREKSSGFKNRLSLKDGESKVGVFRGEPFQFYQHWVNGRTFPCSLKSPAGCEHCKAGNKGSWKFRINFIVLEEGQFVAKVFDGGGKLYDQIVALGKEYDLSTYKMKISRTGTTKDNTVWSAMPAKDGAIPPSELALIEKVQLTKLDDVEADAPAAATDSVPF